MNFNQTSGNLVITFIRQNICISVKVFSDLASDQWSVETHALTTGTIKIGGKFKLFKILSGHSDPDPRSVKDLLKESLNHNNNEIGLHISILLTYVY